MNERTAGEGPTDIPSVEANEHVDPKCSAVKEKVSDCNGGSNHFVDLKQKIHATSLIRIQSQTVESTFGNTNYCLLET